MNAQPRAPEAPSVRTEDAAPAKGRAVTVAFSGHNRKADFGDHDDIAVGLAAAFDLLSRCDVRYATLLTGFAEGSDRVAARVWRACDLGPVHVVHPFLDAPTAQGTGGAHAETWLDGRALEAGGRNAHLAQARWLVGAADVLVAVWSGRGGRGAGGTADAVRLALEHNVPVLWIKPGDAGRVRLIRPEHLEEDFGLMELVEQLATDTSPLVCPATPEGLDAWLGDTGRLPEPAEPDRAPPWEHLFEHTLWRSYAMFVRVLGVGASPSAPAEPPPPDLLEQRGFVHLSAAYAEADAKAVRLAAVHRSQQVLVVLAAIGAAGIGSLPALWPEAKIYAVACELALASLALVISVAASRTERHERWGRARRVAEQLRLERATWVLGLSTEGHRLSAGGPPPREARTARRQAGVAEGRYDADRVRRWGGWALAELVSRQARYHRERGKLNHRIAHRIHRLETASFAVFLFALAGFIVAYAASRMLATPLPHWVAGAVLMTSIVVPTVGAASIALEAGLAFADQSRRNREMAARLEALTAPLGDHPTLAEIQRAAKAAVRLQAVQEDRWTDESARRRLVRAG